MSTMVMRCNGASLTFTIDDENGEVTAVDAVVAGQPITVELLNDVGGVKASFTINASGPINIPKNSRVVIIEEDVGLPGGGTKHIRYFRHRIRW